jgi:uncharacterized damage-inducible protein DinB
MAITDSLVPEFDHEMGTTRRLLERVPEAEFNWKPHSKSMSLGELSNHLSGLVGWTNDVLSATSFDVESAGESFKPSNPASREALLSEFDGAVSAARRALTATTDPELMVPWTLKAGAHEIFTLPRITAIRSFVMNHLIHHRGQLSVYLRLKDVPLPSIYGPTADEQ